MNRLLLRLLVVALLTLGVITDACVGEGHAAIDTATASPPAPVRTCVARQIIYFGEMRYDNDLFAGNKGASCITVNTTTHTLTLASCYKPQGGTVVAYPKIYEGQNYTSGDPESGLPVKVTRAQHYVLHLTATGTPTCPNSNYIQDSDTWFSTSAATADQHGTGELVIALKWRHAYGEQFRLISIAHHWYRLYDWRTSAPGLKHWSIALLLALGQPSSRTIRIATVLYHLRKVGWLGTDEWQDSTALGVECWSGCRGLTVGMTSTR